jgi:type VII secretion-associated serine protease mycosin
MSRGGTQKNARFARYARRGGSAAVAVVVALALAGLAGPATAESEAPVSGDAPVDIPANSYAVTQAPDGQLAVVSGDDTTEVGGNASSTDTPAPAVLSVQPDQEVHALGTGGENDPMRSQQWALDRTTFESAWSVTRGAGVIVAVVDSGVEADHQDLAGSVLPGIDYVNPGGDGRTDPDGHGTHIAGIIAAHVNNGLGIAGAAPAVKILPVRVLDAHGGGVASDVAKGIIWATDHGARVINVSLGGGASPGIEQAMQYANSKGVVVCAAAGNNGQAGNAPMYPAAYPEAIAVAAVDSNLAHPSFGNTGTYIDVSAPGVGIVSSWGSSPTAYALASGTSMATPYASAEAALIIAANPTLSAERVTQLMEGTAKNLGPSTLFGHGLINPAAALYAAQPHPKGFAAKGTGYLIVSSDGRVRAYGGAHFYGDLAGRALPAPIVASAQTKDGKGYWLAGADGSVYSFGSAHNYGSMAGHKLSSPIVGMSATPSGGGYILLGADGGIFTFGNAHFYGSTGNMHLNARVLDVAMTPNGKGYWFVAADGGVFTFGNARFHGSTGNLHLAAPVMSMTASATGKGYWMVASDGGIFAFGVPFEGSMPAVRALTNAPLVPTVRMRALSSGRGYYLLGSNGAVYSFGTAKFFGSAPGIHAVDLMVNN